MKRILVGSSFLMLLAANVFAAGKDPEFRIVDGKVSIQADAITLKQFLQYWDAATGMTSKVNPQLANEKISVRLEGLDLNSAIRKSFQGQPWNWAVVNGKGINVIDRATAVTATPGGIVFLTDTDFQRYAKRSPSSAAAALRPFRSIWARSPRQPARTP